MREEMWEEMLRVTNNKYVKRDTARAKVAM
jgi:hypothetical protein